ncbi:diacylglycerol kinase family protein [Desulfoscipio gibsoniae]|uniref:Diacylglycerol kinase n=1 Tax=Desulfoscipio gibsoniae DSM 7213 TaxID=767817 RepID=R4KGR9_9FIRM|nr:diacylglycerol kinase family protein [Desulfoscipio gibsoniae]AGL00857.1 diacylglycerol kinase [Desulfoscipio gibsoniae DSM 7213]
MLRLIRSFRWAIHGIGYACRTQLNMKIHLLAAALVMAVGLLLQMPPIELAVLSITIFMVLAAEMFNTALEAAVDLVTPEFNLLAKIAKDVAAGAVLLTALNALLVAYLLIWPRLWDLMR